MKKSATTLDGCCSNPQKEAISKRKATRKLNRKRKLRKVLVPTPQKYEPANEEGT